MLRRATYRGAVGVVAALLLALTPGMAAGAAFLKPIPVNLSTDVAPSVAVDAGGNTVFAWQRSDTASSIQGARHAAGATGFLALADFSTDTANSNESPLVVLNGAGNGLVVWTHATGFMSDHNVQLRTISPNGSVGAVQTIDTSGGDDGNLTAAINTDGDAVVAWLNGASTIQAITRQGLGGSFTTAQNLDALGAAPAAAIDGAGNAIVVWTHNGAVNTEIDDSRHVAGALSWGGGQGLHTTNHNYSSPVVAANPTGQMVVAFQDASSGNTVVSDVIGTVSGGWNPTIGTLSAPGVLQGPRSAMDDSGNASVGWTTTSAVQVSTRPAGGAFPAPAGAKPITPVPTGPASFDLAGNGHGAVIAAWYSFETSVMHNVVRAAVKRAGATAFGTSQIVSNSSDDSTSPMIAVDGNGDSIISFVRTSGQPGILAAIYDGAPPSLGKITGPATAKTGTSVSFSVPQPTDAFSSVSSINWSFGDGSAAASGAQVSHSFNAAGSFTVKVTATDAAGNAANVTLPIAVTQGGSIPPPPPPGAKCRVPKLKGKTLSQASTLLRRANCKLGKVTKPKARKHQKLRKLIVSRSSPGAGSVKAAGTKVALTLVQVRKPKPKHNKHK